MSSDYDSYLSHHSSKYRRHSTSHRKRDRSSSSSSNESRNYHRHDRSLSPRRHHSSTNNSQSSRRKSPIKSSRHKSSLNRKKQERSPLSLTPPPPKTSSVPSSFKADKHVYQYDLSQVANNSTDIDGKYFEADEFFIKPFESRKSSKIVYNLDTQTILMPDKSKCELSGPIECSLSKQLFEPDEIRWRRWNDFAHKEWQRLYKEHPDLYIHDKTFFS